jgi:ribosomal protein L11 methyltransferase
MTAIEVPPAWKVVAAGCELPRTGEPILLEPGPGWGDGTHPTTQLCLQAIGALARRLEPWHLLDYGSGSGILGIAAARLGAQVDGVEIDGAAVEHAEANAHLNGVADRTRWCRRFEDAAGPYDTVVANILRSVLLESAQQLATRLSPGGALVLSGLVATDVPEVTVRYANLLGRRPDVHGRGDWRALVWRS